MNTAHLFDFRFLLSRSYGFSLVGLMLYPWHSILFVPGDVTKKALANITGDDDYQFGDITKKAFGNLFGKKGKK